MKTHKYKTHYLSYEENLIIEQFDAGPNVTDEINTIITRPHNDEKTERSVPPMRQKKTITFD